MTDEEEEGKGSMQICSKINVTTDLCNWKQVVFQITGTFIVIQMSLLAQQ